MRIERVREIKGKATTEIAYFVTSLTAAEADPARLLDLNRGHWGIENKLHWRRDVSMSEVRSPGRAGARVMAGLRNLVLAMLRGCNVSVPAARGHYAIDHASAILAVTGGFFEWPLNHRRDPLVKFAKSAQSRVTPCGGLCRPHQICAALRVVGTCHGRRGSGWS